MKSFLKFFLIGMQFWLLGCQESKTVSVDSEPKGLPIPVLDGKALMEAQCSTCHNPSAKHHERIAPAMIAIKLRYLETSSSEARFVAAIQDWMEAPSVSQSKMPGAIRKFGVMPFVPHQPSDIEAIAKYLYRYQIEIPQWFPEHYENQHQKPFVNTGIPILQDTTRAQSIKSLGMDYAVSTKKQLGKHLMNALKDAGTLAALEYCNTNAYPITDSMSQRYKVKIKRVSDLPRNPLNAANSLELKHIKTYKEQLVMGERLMPIVEKNEGKTKFYYPITTNTMCLQCHGTLKTQIKEPTLRALKRLYPSDKATGYATNELRGIWSITFDE